MKDRAALLKLAQAENDAVAKEVAEKIVGPIPSTVIIAYETECRKCKSLTILCSEFTMFFAAVRTILLKYYCQNCKHSWKDKITL